MAHHPAPWPLKEWLKMAALLLAVGAASTAAWTWAWSRLEAPEIEARTMADAKIEVRYIGLSDSVRKVYSVMDNRVGILDAKLDRVLEKLESRR